MGLWEVSPGIADNRSVFHEDMGLRTVKELARSYLTISKDLTRVMSRLKAIYRSWAIPCASKQVIRTLPAYARPDSW
jgi:hypothetical protein